MNIKSNGWKRFCTSTKGIPVHKCFCTKRVKRDPRPLSDRPRAFHWSAKLLMRPSPFVRDTLWRGEGVGACRKGLEWWRSAITSMEGSRIQATWVRERSLLLSQAEEKALDVNTECCACALHCGLEKPKIQTAVLGHSLVRSLIRSHR